MTTEYRWPVTSYSITVNDGSGFGWIQLKDGDRDAGYIYFEQNPPQDGHFGGLPSDHPYIVMHQPINNWPVILDILRNEKPLFIRGFQSSDGQPVSTFFGTSTDEPAGEGE